MTGHREPTTRERLHAFQNLAQHPGFLDLYEYLEGRRDRADEALRKLGPATEREGPVLAERWRAFDDALTWVHDQINMLTDRLAKGERDDG